MRFLRRSLVGLFLLALTVGLFAWAGSSFYSALQTRWNEEERSRPSRERVFAANVLTYQPQTVTPLLTSFGEVHSRRTLELRAPSGGRVVALAEGFEEGGKVEAGQFLLQIDPADAQAALDTALADQQEAEAELRDATRGLTLATDELAAAQDQVRLRERALARQQNLLDRGVGTEAAVEAAELAVSSAKQAVLTRRQAVANAEARLDQAQTSLARRKINVVEAERALNETRIVAGFSGTLSDVAAELGGLVAPNERLAQIIDATALEVALRVSTPQYARLVDENGQLLSSRATIGLDVFGIDLTTQGTITRESAAVGEGQTGRLLFARIDDPNGLRPGDFVTVRIEEPPLNDVAILPSAALDSNSNILVVGADDRLEVAPVVLLRRQGDMVIVRGDNLAGRDVVAQRSPLLGAGIKVRPIRPPADGADATQQVEPELIELTQERRARLVEFVESNEFMPDAAKERVLGQLKEEKVPAQVVERIESRMGG